MSVNCNYLYHRPHHHHLSTKRWLKCLSFLNLMQLDRVFATIHSMFIQWVYVLVIAPKFSPTLKLLNYIVPTLIGISVVLLYGIRIYFRLIHTSIFSELSKVTLVLYGLFEISLIYTCLGIILSYWMLWKHRKWQQMYNIFGLLKQCNKRPNKLEVYPKLVLIVFIFVNVMQTYSTFMYIYSIYKQYDNIATSLLLVSTPTIQFLYSSTQAAYMLLVLLDIKRLIEEARGYVDVVNLKMARLCFLKAKVASNLFSELFGYQLLLMIFKWICSLLVLFLTVYLAANSETSAFHYMNTTAVLMILGKNAVQVAVSVTL